MAGGTNQWPPNGDGPGGQNVGGWDAQKAIGIPSGPPSQAYSNMVGGWQGGGWGGNYGFKPKGPTQWAGPNAQYPNWNDDPSSGYANDVAMIQEGGGWQDGGANTWGNPWTGGGGGFGPGLMWDVQDGPGSGMWNEPEGGYGNGGYVETPVEEEAVAASPFNWGSVGAGRLAKAQEFAALGQMGRAKNVFTSGDKGGAWSPEIHQQLRTFKTGA